MPSTPSAENHLKKVFHEALAKGTPEERQAYLNSIGAQDRELRQQLDSLLVAYSESGDFLQQNVIDTPRIGEGPGTVIGRYKLLQQIGEGGFGIVFMAEQQEPVRRMVALKIIKAGMDTREVVARFEAERQALALMDHPNIAKVLDGGATESGRPYFVMDLVKGVPLTEFCDQHRLRTEARLRLFLQVCSAVQHAHQKGVIHRDLKPTNVLVTLHDGQPVPKVIDFGISKAIGAKLTDKTLFTRFEQLMGTPSYMSPEQAEWSGLDVDTRSDIYSLGVLLYELLTGTTPLEKETVTRAALDEIRRLIRETDPPAPSTRLQRLGPKATAIATQRQTEAGGLFRLIRGDLDWVVMKALEKDRTRRYETVNALTRDVERHLEGEAVTACPPSAVYRMRKFMHRHKLGVAVSAFAAVSLLIGFAFAMIGFARARQESRRAQEQTSIAQAVNDFLLKDLLGQASPEGGMDKDITMRELLDRASTNIASRFTNQPLVEAAIRATVGDTYRWLAKQKEAEAHLQRAVDIRTERLGPDHKDTLDAAGNLALAINLRDPEEGRRRALEVAERVESVFSPDDQLTRSSWHSVAVLSMESDSWRAEEILRDLLVRGGQTHGPTQSETLLIQSRLATLAGLAGRHAESIATNELVLGIERQNPNWHTPEVLAALADSYYKIGDTSKAIARQTEHVELAQRSLSPTHPRTLNAIGELAHFYGSIGQWTQCLNLKLTLLTNEANIAPGYLLRGAVAALVIENTNAYTLFAAKLVSLFSDTTEWDSVITVVMVTMLRPELFQNLDPVFKIAEAIPRSRAGYLDGSNLAKGMAAYRRGDLVEALKFFEGWERSGGSDELVGAIGGSFTAMIRFRQGDVDTARKIMVDVRNKMQMASYSGDLGVKWFLYGEAAAVRAEAAKLLFGETGEPIADSATLEAARARWLPIRESLNEGDRLAVQKKWEEASRAYLAAIRHPTFLWEAAEAANSEHNSILAGRIGITFLLANNANAHDLLCQEMFALAEKHSAPGILWHMLRTCFAGRIDPDGETMRRAGKWVNALVHSPGGVTPEAISLIRTMHAYRLGKYAEAADLSNVNGRLSVRNVAQLFRAMSLAKLGRLAEGKNDLTQAETNLMRPLKDLRGDLWWDLAMCQLLLDEARSLFNTGK